MIRALAARVGLISSAARRKVGEDAAGNVYYVAAKASPTGHGTFRERRMVVPPSGNEFDFDQETVPRLWASWLAGTSPHPPTPDQLDAESMRRHDLAAKVEALEAKDRAIDSPSAPSAGGAYINHASIREYAKPATSAKPGTGAGGVFRPGAWTPVDDLPRPSSNTAATVKEDTSTDETSEFVPQGWTPGRKK
eukprot:m.84425 g.84425  ORF g.84425 m.84425 type:complete len:193 (+) comp9595_c0_seq1:97-675(+)